MSPVLLGKAVILFGGLLVLAGLVAAVAPGSELSPLELAALFGGGLLALAGALWLARAAGGWMAGRCGGDPAEGRTWGLIAAITAVLLVVVGGDDLIAQIMPGGAPAPAEGDPRK